MKRRTLAELHARAAAEMQVNPPISYTVVGGQVRYANTADAIRAVMTRLSRAVIGFAKAFERMREAAEIRP
ncbi:hypothetical protein HZU38_05590 [Mycolicibacterium vanbaalenii]|uniref:hypothetical protein n=1 Tax=Mycolicibacterium vanbaalenii TaxID=110539 RepID=UPI001F367573|nr:hypothetical protein [Mycolicibacterium vanbaalenii]UJL29973.1 hypothetical protein HZU38_05590 [Mycolicibacterium vanbaalenii]WND56965.1 hypothetical protein QQA43_00685 [Mycolicibacterium vanbaalenii]